MKLSLITLLTFVVFVGCKTREDIQREKLVENMNTQMQDTQKLSADFTVRLQNLEERISMVTGKVEEGHHETQKTLDTRLIDLESKINLMEENQKAQEKEIRTLKTKSDAQAAYLKEVLDNLKNLSGGKGSKSSSKLSPYQDAMNDYKKGRYASAKQKLLILLNGNKVKGGAKLRTIHNLGMIAYMDKENDKALAYFSRLFSETPKSGYNKNGLLFLAKTFKRMNKNEEAKQTLQELISRFPKARQVKQAKKMLKSL